MAPLFGAIGADGSSHITSSSVYSPYPPPLRSSRARQPIAQPTVFENIRHSIHSLFSSNASTVDASTPPPLPGITPKPESLPLNTSQWTLPTFAFADEPDHTPSANFAFEAPLYEPHPVANWANPTAADQSPRLDETQRNPATYRPLASRTSAEMQPSTGQNQGVRTPPAVYEFRRQSRLDMRGMMSEAGNSAMTHQNRERDGHRRQFSGADREELILCHEIESNQQMHKEHKRKASEGKNKSTTKRNKKHGQEKMCNGRYKPCLSTSDKRLRRKSIGCFVAGGALIITVATYLALALSGNPLSSTGHVLLILLIAAITLIFCHFLLAVARMAFAKPHKSSSPSHAHNRRQNGHHHRHVARDLERQDEHGYAVPAQPVPITFAESAQQSYFAPDHSPQNSRQGTPNKVIPPPPPAYGIWRESVRVDPNRIFWARNPNAQSTSSAPAQHQDTLAMLEGRTAGETGGNGRPALRRPPSYASDVSALSEEGERRAERDTWGRERDEQRIEEVSSVESEVQRMFVHPSLRR